MSVNQAVKGIYEKEPQRLQREADDYTRQVESKKKAHLRFQDAAKNTQKDVEVVEARIKKMIPSKEDIHAEIVKRTQMTNKVRHKKVLLNNTIGINKSMKECIDSMRREIMFAKSAIGSLKSSVNDLKISARDAHKVSQKMDDQSNELNNQILAAKHLRELQTAEAIKEECHLEAIIDRRAPKENFEAEDKQKAAEAQGANKKGDNWANPIVVLERKMARQQDRNKEKTRLMDRFVRNAKIIEKSFETIKSNSGFGSIDEIVTTYLKAEEQQYDLAYYFNVLDGESDELMRKNASLDAEIEAYTLLRLEGKVKIKQKVATMQTQADALKGTVGERKEEIQTALEDYQQIQTEMDSQLSKFRQADFKAGISGVNEMPYDDSIVMSETNIIGYLKDLEEQISHLITMNAAKKGDPNAMLSTLNLQNMNLKSFDNKTKLATVPHPLTNDVFEREYGAVANDPNEEIKTAAGEDAETVEAGDYANIATLQKRFQEMVKTSHKAVEDAREEQSRPASRAQ